MDRITAEIRSRNMSRIKSKNTAPELIIRKQLFQLGYRYRVHYPLAGSPDIVFLKKKIAIFIHGCYWHGHACKIDHIPKTNKDFWNNKIVGNKIRDRKNLMVLKKTGWKVFIIWECKIIPNPVTALRKLVKYLNGV